MRDMGLRAGAAYSGGRKLAEYIPSLPLSYDLWSGS